MTVYNCRFVPGHAGAAGEGGLAERGLDHRRTDRRYHRRKLFRRDPGTVFIFMNYYQVFYGEKFQVC